MRYYISGFTVGVRFCNSMTSWGTSGDKYDAKWANWARKPSTYRTSSLPPCCCCSRDGPTPTAYRCWCRLPDASYIYGPRPMEPKQPNSSPLIFFVFFFFFINYFEASQSSHELLEMSTSVFLVYERSWLLHSSFDYLFFIKYLWHTPFSHKKVNIVKDMTPYSG